MVRSNRYGMLLCYQSIDLVLTVCCCCRHASDLVMMVSFGDGKERNQQQFKSLFEASGWRLTQVTPTSGIFMVIEAEPKAYI
jgi:hypothetical protein